MNTTLLKSVELRPHGGAAARVNVYADHAELVIASYAGVAAYWTYGTERKARAAWARICSR